MAGSVATGLVNNAINQFNTHKERQWQERMMHYQNSYNHPAADFIRKRAAGVNPFAGELNSQPAASVGSPGAADSFPLTDPLAALKTFSEIDNINATTNKTETETDKLLKDITMLDMALERGIIEKKEYERRVELMFEEWQKRNPYTVDRELKDSQTSVNVASANVSEQQALKVESDRLFTDALTATENALRDLKVNLTKAQTFAANAAGQASLAQASKLLAEGKTVQLQNQRELLRNSATMFYGFDPTTLPAELAGTLMNNFASVVEHNWDSGYAKRAMDLCHQLLDAYRGKSIWTPTSSSYSWNGSVRVGDFSISRGSSVANSN